MRDGFLGRAVRDIDLVYEGDPRRLARSAVRCRGSRYEYFDRFKTTRIFLGGGLRMDIARARTETYDRPAALPKVRFGTLEADLGRRDFSVNAMARVLGPNGPGALLDPFNGKEDLGARRLRALHPLSFRDDPTRLFRAARYAGRLGLRPERLTAAWIRKAVSDHLPGLLSRERVRQEFVRILEEADPVPALRLAGRWGLNPYFHPGFCWASSLRRTRDAHVRLGLCLLRMGPEKGAEFLRSLPFERGVSQALAAALETASAAASPRRTLPAIAAECLSIHFGRLKKAALQPLLVDGGDLRRLGLPPGKAYASWLERAARAQWRGEFVSKKTALRWLERAYGKSPF